MLTTPHKLIGAVQGCMYGPFRRQQRRCNAIRYRVVLEQHRNAGIVCRPVSRPCWLLHPLDRSATHLLVHLFHHQDRMHKQARNNKGARARPSARFPYCCICLNKVNYSTGRQPAKEEGPRRKDKGKGGTRKGRGRASKGRRDGRTEGRADGDGRTDPWKRREAGSRAGASERSRPK